MGFTFQVTYFCCLNRISSTFVVRKTIRKLFLKREWEICFGFFLVFNFLPLFAQPPSPSFRVSTRQYLPGNGEKEIPRSGGPAQAGTALGASAVPRTLCLAAAGTALSEQRLGPLRQPRARATYRSTKWQGSDRAEPWRAGGTRSCVLGGHFTYSSNEPHEEAGY